MTPNAVWVLHHVTPEDDASSEDVKLIGVYATKAAAEAAIGRLIVQPGFRDWPNAFECDQYALNGDNWKEGFVRISN